MFNNVYYGCGVVILILSLCAAQTESTQQSPHKFILSPCGTPMSINFTGLFNAYETACTQFRATSLLEVVNISFYFDDIEHTSSPADLDLTITALESHLTLHIGGWDDDARIADDLEWPNQWQFSAEAGLYSAALDVQSLYIDDDGVYEICIMNKWLNSGEAIYNGLIQLQGMVSDCTTTLSPTITPEFIASSRADCAGQTGVTVGYDVAFSGRDKKCMTPFIAQGELLAMNVDLKFTVRQKYLGVVPVQQTMWPADLEFSLTQVSSNLSVVVGYDPLDNQFSGDDDGSDSDSGSYFYGISLNDTSGGGVTDLMSASLWLSPSSNLTEVMTTGVESCDQTFCSKFATSTTFVSYGNADSNHFYPRYVKNMTAPFNVNAQILKNFACDDHFLVLSRLPLGSTFSYGVRPETITFAWDCKHKYIFAEGSQTSRGEFCGNTGFYDVEVGIDAAGFAYFRDNICGEMKIQLDVATGPWYLFIGSDNDNADPTVDDDVNENKYVSSGLNRYRLEWPTTWAVDGSGDYAASLLPKSHNFEQVGEYQLCVANTWGSYSQADVEGTVLLVGMQSCDSLVCAPGDRSFCSGQGECRSDGTGCSCDDNRTFSTADTCASPSSADDFLFGYEHSIVLLGCFGGALVLLAMAVLVFVYKNNEAHDVNDCDVEAVDLKKTAASPPVAANVMEPHNTPSNDLSVYSCNLEIPPRQGQKVSQEGGGGEEERVVDSARYNAYQVHRQSPLSPLKSPTLKQSMSGRQLVPSGSKKQFPGQLPDIPRNENEKAEEGGNEEDDDESTESTAMITTAVVKVSVDESEGVLLGGDDDDDDCNDSPPPLPPPSSHSP